ncbi:MAG TPA: MlaD family protein [Nitrospiria bacterium]
MGKFTTEAKVGLAVILGIIFLTYMTFTIGNFKWGKPEGYEIKALLDSAAGLDIKSPVRIAGVEVGKVEQINLSDGKARVLIRIKPEIQIRRGAKAVLRAEGLLGEKYLEIIPGEEAEFLQDQDQMEQSAKAADLDKLIEQFSAIAEDIKMVTSTFREVLGNKPGKESLKDIVANIRELSKTLNLTLKENKEAFSKTMDNFEEFSSFVKEETPKLVESLNKVVARLEKGEGTLGKLLTEEGVYDNLEKSLENLKKITKRVEEGEGTIGKLFSDDKAYENLNTTLEGLGNAVQRFERFKTVIGFRHEYQFSEKKNKGYFSLKLQPSEDKFYLLEVTDDPRGRFRETTNVTTVGGVTTTITNLEVSNKIKFNLLFGKRFYGVDLRLGLMENTFGGGADYQLFDKRLRVSLDLWDVDSEDPQMPNPRLKTTLSYSFFKYVFIQGGWDNLMNPELSTPFGGLGITFDDEDLKYLISGVGVGSLAK